MTRMLVDLYRSGYKLKHLENFRVKHAIAVVKHWQKLGLAASTIASYVSHLKTFCGWLGKPALVESIQEYVDANPGLTERHTATDRDKSERGAGVPFEEILRRARELGDESFCCLLSLNYAFGLRPREAWLFRPHLAEYSPGRIYIGWGTKGGRPRWLPCPMSDKQRGVLEWARRLVPTRAESMVPRGYTVKQWAYRYYRLCRRIGLTRKGLGVTPHSLRHGALLDLYENLSGAPAPVRSEDGLRPDPAVDRAAREVVSEAAGHSRTSVVSAYLGGVRPSGAG